MRLFSAGAALTIAIAIAQCAASPIYTITDLGTLGGPSTTGFAVSSNGQAAGWGTDALGNTQALIFGGTSPSVFWSNGQATGINSAGQVSGNVWSGSTQHGIVWSKGITVDLGANTSAAAINDAGQVAGSGTQAFLYQNGTTANLGTLAGGNWSLAEGLSGNGDVAGYGDTPLGIRGFVWTPGGGLEQLFTLGGANSYAMSVNDAGIVAGSAAIASENLHAATWQNGTVADLGTLGGSNSYGYGINNLGTLVGYSWLASDNATHAFIAVNGIMVDLNSLLWPQNSGWVVTAAYGINEQGQIAGEATYNGQSHAVLLNDPPGPPDNSGPAGSSAPEPATWLLAGGALLLGGLFRSRLSRSR